MLLVEGGYMPARVVDYARAAFDIVDDLERAGSTEQVMHELASALSGFGYTAFLITGVPEPPGRVEAYFLLNGWPQGFSAEYHRQNYYQDDPIASWCRRSMEPYEWAEARYDPEARPRAAEVMRLANDFNMKKGFCVPIMRGNGFTACVTMAGDKPDFEPQAKKAMHLISLYAHMKAASFLKTDDGAPIERKLLTRREREALKWIGAGKSSWEAARIMGISERTVNKFIIDASRKLDAATRTHAVVKAIASKEIDIPA
jgi:LuxR family transcriptional regulator, quorum-sensing system regulator BjaR1